MTSPPHNSVNAGEWVQITFDLLDDNMFEDVIVYLDAGDLRIGVHLIALPDGLSESAILVPEPSAVLLLGLGAVMLRRRR